MNVRINNPSRRNRRGYAKMLLAVFITFQMLLTPAAAGISAWSGPPTMSATTGNDDLVNGWEVASNATILAGEFSVNEDGGEADGNGIGFTAGVPGLNFTSSGIHDGTTGSHFDDLLSLAPNGSFTSVETLDEIIYNFGYGFSQSSGGIFEVGELLNVPGNVTNGTRNLAHGDIPAAPFSGVLSAGTLIGQPLPAGTDEWLQGPQIVIPTPVANFTFSIEHWEHFDAGDGAWLEYRLDNGNWNWIEPVGGYTETIDSSAPVPASAPSSGSGFPVWGSDVATGWQSSTFELDNLIDDAGVNITNASTFDVRLRVWTSATSAGAPGIFFDDIEIENIGAATGFWHHGCYDNTGASCFYQANADSALEVEVDLGSAITPITVELTAEWDLEGSVYDNFLVQVSQDQTTWTDITNAGNIYGIPYNGYTVAGTTYGDESAQFLLMEFDIPNAFAGDNTTWVRIKVKTDGSVNSGGVQDDLEGVTVDRIKVIDGNSVVQFDDHFTSASTATHYATGGIDDWGFEMIGAGGLYIFEGMEDAPSVPTSEWTMANPTGEDLWEYGTVASCTNCGNYASPSSAFSSPYAFATGLDTAYITGYSQTGSFTPLEGHVYTPQYVIPTGASARFVFEHNMCAYQGYGGGALFISTDSGTTWTHFDPGVAGGTGTWYDGPNMYNWYSHSLTPGGISLDVWDGSSSGCTATSNWQTKVGDLTSYGGQTVEFRFTFVGIYNFNYPGWYVDDIGVEVDYFDAQGEWVSPLISTEELGNGFVDITAIEPTDTEITATVYDSLMNAVPGFIERDFPLSLAGINLDDVATGFHIGINIDTDDPYISGLIQAVHIGSDRMMYPGDLAVNDWEMDSALIEADGNITSAGTTGWITTDFVQSTRPIQEIYVDGEGSGVRVYITDAEGNQYGGLPLQSRIYLPYPLSGYGVEIEVGPGDWLEYMYAEGEFWQPALNPMIDAVDDGTIDWTFNAAPNFGHLGWQNRIAGDGLTAMTDTVAEILTVDGSNPGTTTILIPAQATVYDGFLTLMPSSGVADDLNVTIAGVSAASFSAGWEVAAVPLDTATIAAIHSMSATYTDPTGRDWFEVGIEVSSVGASYDVLLGGVAIGYHLSETVTGLEDQLYDYHEAEKMTTSDDSISIPLRLSADAGTVGISGEVYHELLITNEPFAVPETLYPDGQDITITTGHHHLYQTTQIDTIILTGEASSGQLLQFELTDVQTNPSFLQTIGSEAAVLDTAASSVSLIGDSWSVDWVFQTNWHWDDEAELLWSAQAYNHTGYGLAPATSLTGGPGTQAIENDLELDSVAFTDQLGRTIEFMPGIPPWVQGGSEVEISGTVRFQNTLDTRPPADDFLVSVNLSGNEVLTTSTAAGEWSTTLQIPASDEEGLLVEMIQAGPWILQVGPTGATTAEDVTGFGWLYSMQVDTNAPTVNALHAKTSFGLKDADGYTWDPTDPLLLQLDIEDIEGMSDSVTVHYWRESVDDIDGDGEADENEYWTASKGLIESRKGEQYIDLPSIDVSMQQNNKRVSLYVTGTDFVGLPFSNGGGPGLDNDLSTVVTAINTVTSLDFNSLTLDRVEERLLLGQVHELSMTITEENGIETLDEIRVQLLGDQNAPRGEFVYVPKTDTWYAEVGSYITIDLVTVEEITPGTYMVNMYFSIDWDFPVILANNFQSPAILIFDDDMNNPVVPATNLGEIRWKIDYEVKAVVDELLDSTPPVSESSSSNLVVQQGDEVLVMGHIGFAASGAPMVNVPSGLIVEFHLQYGSTSLDEQAPVAFDGTFEVPFLLPDRALAKPTLELEFEIMGLIGSLEDATSPQADVTVDSTAPRLQFVGQTLNVLYSDNMHGLTVTAQVTEEIGMPQAPLVLHWLYKLNGAAIAGSEGTADLTLVSVAGPIWTYQADIDFNPENHVDLADNPQLLVWVVGTDMAGFPLNGEGTELVPISPALVLKTFDPAISYVEVLPTSENTIKLGSVITVTVTMVNEGNQEGNVNVSLVESDSQGEWRTIEKRTITLGPGKTERMAAFEFTVVRSGQQSLYLMLDENYVDLLLVESPVVESADAVSGGFAGVSEDTLMGVGALLFIIVVAALVLLILRRGGSDEDYWYEDDDEMFEGKSDPGAASPVAPPPGPIATPPAGPVEAPPVEPALTYVSDWQQLPSNGDWDSRPDGTWYVTEDGQQWKQEADGSFHRMV